MSPSLQLVFLFLSLIEYILKIKVTPLFATCNACQFFTKISTHCFLMVTLFIKAVSQFFFMQKLCRINPIPITYFMWLLDVVFRKNTWSESLLLCSIILKCMLNLILVTWPKWVHKHFKEVAEEEWSWGTP